MKAFVFVGVVLLIQACCATLLIKGPTGPVIEGEPVTMECVSSDPEFNVSQAHFEMLSKYLPVWHSIREYNWCFYSMQVERTADSLTLTIPHVRTYYDGSYRCVSNADNGTDFDNSTQSLTLKVHYMGELSLLMKSYSRFLSVPREVVVRKGEEVELKCFGRSSEEPNYFWRKEDSDWILPSDTLTLMNIDELDEGQYTCMAEHSLPSLSRKKTLTITILPEDTPWYETSNGRILLATGSGAAVIMVLILSLVVFLCRRVKQAKTTKGPIDDRSEKKPIYKTSVDSLPSTCGDKQPLV